MADDEHGARGNGDGADYAKRNAERETQFRALPPAGSAEYWAAIEATAGDNLLPLEVLAMCMRERLAAGAREQSNRVFAVIARGAEGILRGWLTYATRYVTMDRPGLIDDLVQRCQTKMWIELSSSKKTFFTVGFLHRLKRLMLNELTQELIERGLRPRPGVDIPTRIPRTEMDSLDRPVSPDDPHTVGDVTPAPDTEDAHSLIETVNDIRELVKDLSSEERQLLWNELTGEMTQKQLAEHYGVTDRTIRLWLNAIHAKLRDRRDNGGSHGEEGHRG